MCGISAHYSNCRLAQQLHENLKWGAQTGSPSGVYGCMTTFYSFDVLALSHFRHGIQWNVRWQYACGLRMPDHGSGARMAWVVMVPSIRGSCSLHDPAAGGYHTQGNSRRHLAASTTDIPPMEASSPACAPHRCAFASPAAVCSSRQLLTKETDDRSARCLFTIPGWPIPQHLPRHPPRALFRLPASGSALRSGYGRVA